MFSLAGFESSKQFGIEPGRNTTDNPVSSEESDLAITIAASNAALIEEMQPRLSLNPDQTRPSLDSDRSAL